MQFKEPQHRLLIINADDYGYNLRRDIGVQELLIAGKITSLSAIVNGISISSSSEFVLGLSPDCSISVGLHFNLTEGLPCSQDSNSKLVADGQFRGKAYIYENPPQEEEQKWIAGEFQLQIETFMRLFRRRPSHVDGHNHVHVLPHVAQAIAPLLARYGIYRVRMPLESGLELKQGTYLHKFVQNAKNSQGIYSGFSIVSPTFIGLGMMGNLSANQVRSKLENHAVVELMCHPGFRDPVSACQFTRSQQREAEKLQLQSLGFAQFELMRGSYHDMSVTPTCQRVLIYSKMCEGSGNYTTSLRLKAILESLQLQVYLRSVEEKLDPYEEVRDLSRFLHSFRISLVFGVNLTRTSPLLYRATRGLNCPYILIVAGTDANIYFKTEQSHEQLLMPIRDCLCLVSISEYMSVLTTQFLASMGTTKNVYLITQSSILQASFRKEQLPALSRSYIIFPTSFRAVKCVGHVLEQLNILIHQYGIDVYVVGPIIDQPTYESCSHLLQRVQYIGVLSRADYLSMLQRALFLINTSHSEGMSCSILQAFEMGIPVLARANQGNSELVTDGVSGLLYHQPCDFLSQASRLILDSSLRSMLIKKAGQLLREKYSFEGECKKYEDLLRRERIIL